MSEHPMLTLRKAARDLAAARGHRLGVWHAFDSTADEHGWNFCESCGAKVTVDTVSMNISEIVPTCPGVTG